MMGFFDDPYEVNGVHYRSWETYNRARKRAEAAGKRAEGEARARRHRELEREVKREVKSHADVERRVRREMEAKERALRELSVEEQKTRREELRLERARMQEEAADRRAAEAAKRAAEEAQRALALTKLNERMEAEAEAWSRPANLGALDDRREADPGAAAAALAGPRPVPPNPLPLMEPMELEEALEIAGRLRVGDLRHPQVWWPSLLPEEAYRSEEDLAAERDRIARAILARDGIKGERSPLPGSREAWKEAYGKAYLAAEPAMAVPIPENIERNSERRSLLARCVAKTVGESRTSVTEMASFARDASLRIRTEARGRQRAHAEEKALHAAAMDEYEVAAASWTAVRDGWIQRLTEAADAYREGRCLASWHAAAAAWSLDPYVPGTPEVAAAADEGRGIIDIIIPALDPPPSGVRPLPDGHLEPLPLPRERARDLVERAARHLVVRVLVEAFRKDPLGHLSEITVNAWSTGVPVGPERRGVAFLSSATADRDLALAYNGDAEAFLRAAGAAEPARTTVHGGTLIPMETLPVWHREEA